MNDTCKICKHDRKGHQQLELIGNLHHKYSENGEVKPSTAVQDAAAAEKAKKAIGPADTVLRAILMDLGIVSFDALARKELELREQSPHTRPRADG